MDNQKPYFLEYYEKIKSGEIVVNKYILIIYEQIVKNYYDKDFPCFYNDKKALLVIAFIETFCRHSKGEWGGKPVILELWQKAFISVLFGFVCKETGLRQYRELFLLVARKNGKSLLISAIACYLLFADGECGAELYSVATKRDQSKIIWDETVSMIKKSPALKRRCKCLVNSIKFKDSIFKPLGSDSDSSDGLNSQSVLIDELHAIKDRNIYDVMKDSTSSRRQPLIIIATTNGTVRGNIFDSKYNEMLFIINSYKTGEDIDYKILPLLYQLDDVSEWQDELAWIKANPNLGVSKKISYLKNAVEKAVKFVELRVNLLCKDFNMSQNSSLSYFDFATIDNKETFDINKLKIKHAIGGLDISSTTDLTSATILFLNPLFPEKLFFHSCSWIPSYRLEQKIKEDNIPYDKWVERGFLRLCKGNKIDPIVCLDWLTELYKQKGIIPYKLGFDPWGSQTFVNEFEKYFGKDILVPIRQGARTFSNPLKSIKADFEASEIVYNNDPCVKTALINVSIKVDDNENIRPVKQKQRGRIDPFMAMLNAYTVYQDNKVEFSRLSNR